MSKGMMTLIAVAVGIALLIGVPVVSYFTAWSAGNRAEQNIAARWEDNENVLAQYMQKVKETAQVPGMQRDDLIAVFTGANESRYVKTGSAATMQWIREQNPNLDQATYRQIQQVIEAGRNEFKNVQTRLVDAKRSGAIRIVFYLHRGDHHYAELGFIVFAFEHHHVLSHCFYRLGECNRPFGYPQRVLAEDCLGDVLFVHGFKEPAFLRGANAQRNFFAAQGRHFVIQLLLLLRLLRLVLGAHGLKLGYLFRRSGLGELLREQAVDGVAVGNVLNLAVHPHPPYVFEQNYFHTKSLTK